MASMGGDSPFAPQESRLRQLDDKPVLPGLRAARQLGALSSRCSVPGSMCYYRSPKIPATLRI